MGENKIDRLMVDVLKLGRKGVSQKEMMAHHGITLKEWNKLKKENEAFADACELSTNLSLAFYMDALRKRTEEGSDALIKFALERIHGLNEKVEQEVTGSGIVEVSFASLKRPKASDAD